MSRRLPLRSNRLASQALARASIESTTPRVPLPGCSHVPSPSDRRRQRGRAKDGSRRVLPRSQDEKGEGTRSIRVRSRTRRRDRKDVPFPFPKGEGTSERKGRMEGGDGLERGVGSGLSSSTRLDEMVVRRACWILAIGLAASVPDDETVGKTKGCSDVMGEASDHGCASDFVTSLRDAVRSGDGRGVSEACETTCRQDAMRTLKGMVAVGCGDHVPWRSDEEVRLVLRTRRSTGRFAGRGQVVVLVGIPLDIFDSYRSKRQLTPLRDPSTVLDGPTVSEFRS